MQTGKFRDGAALNGQRCPFFKECATLAKTVLPRSALQDFVQGISETLNGYFRPIADAHSVLVRTAAYLRGRSSFASGLALVNTTG